MFRPAGVNYYFVFIIALSPDFLLVAPLLSLLFGTKKKYDVKTGQIFYD